MLLDFQFQIYEAEFIDEYHILSAYADDYDDLLEKISRYSSNNLEICAVGMYTSQDWDGVLGAAYIGDTNNVGICQEYSSFVITSSLRRGFVTEPIHQISTMHELGHLMGSLHDPLDKCTEHCYSGKFKKICSPPGLNKYIMSSYALPGTYKNNYYYSTCSIKSILSLGYNRRKRSCLA